MSATMQPITGKAAPIPTLAEILHANPDKFVQKYTDIAAINLACAVGLPTVGALNIPKCLQTLDAMARWVRTRTANSWHLYEKDPAHFDNSKNLFRVVLMVQFLHKQFGVDYHEIRRDPADEYYDPKDVGDHFIHGLIEKRIGTCATLPVFAAAIGRRLGYPLKLVKVPRHLFFRWEDGTERFNVEFGGANVNVDPDGHYYTWPVRWTPAMFFAQPRTRWLYSLSPAEEVADFLGNRATILEGYNHISEALMWVSVATRFNPVAGPAYEQWRRHLFGKLKRSAARPPVAKRPKGAAAALALPVPRVPNGVITMHCAGGNAGCPVDFAQYPRKRIMDPRTGRFTSLDSFAGDDANPLSLNKYLYTNGDPVNGTDPSGYDVVLGGVGLAIGVALAADPGAILGTAMEQRSLDNIRKVEAMGGFPTLPAYHARLAAIGKDLKKKWPELYIAMGFDKFFAKLEAAVRAEVRNIRIDLEVSAEAEYSIFSKTITISKPLKEVNGFTLVHESVHAWDDKEDWYLNSTYFWNVRKAEGLGYGAEFMMSTFDDLLRLKGRQGKLPDWQRSWDNFWMPFLNSAATFDKPVYVNGIFKGNLTHQDLDDVKQKLGLHVDYAAIAPLFGLPPNK